MEFDLHANHVSVKKKQNTQNICVYHCMFLKVNFVQHGHGNEQPYREVVSTGDCTSILLVMCLRVMACKQTPNKQTKQKDRGFFYFTSRYFQGNVSLKVFLKNVALTGY